ncbi:MAG: flavodoxin reductase [Owenweeksia sp.]|nr:flavodoxin reductase [Owenweeksia sp.]MBF98661.1 flavodoxin reductase [Owenweeksia sp.]HBF20437.1 flavodoxin reductase [Cryomorphaceae bacterium]
MYPNKNMDYKQKVKSLDWLAHNAVQLRVEKPAGFEYQAGDAVEIKVGDQDSGPFTMTNLPDESYLEFVIRIYPDHNGKTKAISKLSAGDEIEFTEPFGTFQEKEGAIFLAGGTGITPFLAIMRKMYEVGKLENSLLFFSNKTRKDLFLEKELRAMLGDRYQNVITEDKEDPEYYGEIDGDYLKNRIGDLSKPLFICGPPPFDKAMQEIAESIGIETNNMNLSS